MPEQPSTLTPSQIYQRAYREANKEKSRAWREANKARLVAYQRIYCATNKEAVAENMRAWREANPDYKRAWREANPEYDSEYRREWCEANPEALRNYNAKRRADTIGEITPGWISKLLELQRWTCIVCLKDLRYGYHIDHIYPVSKGGENTDYNLQALCPKCNHEKSNKDPIDFMRSRGFLL